MTTPDPSPSLLTENDLYLFNEGSHFRLYDKFGARVVTQGGVSGVTVERVSDHMPRLGLAGVSLAV